MRFLVFLAALIGTAAQAVPLSTVSSFCTSYPDQCNIGNQSLTVVRGTGTNAYYVLEADPTTGEIPVSIATGITVSYAGDTGDPVPSQAAYVGGIDDSGDLQGLHVDAAGNAQVDVLTMPYDQNFGAPGASTLRSACMLGVGSAAVANGNPVPISDAGGAITVDGSVSATNFPATVDTDYGAAGASTPRSACMLGLGSAVVSNANPVPISDAGGIITVDGTVAISNLPSTADTNYGTPGASTVRTAAMLGIGSAAASATNPVPQSTIGTATGDTKYNDYSSTNVTTGAWVQMIASTANTINTIYITDTCGQVLELGTGAVASETRVLLIPRGGLAERVTLRIASGTRVALRAISGNCSSGDFVFTGLQ